MHSYISSVISPLLSIHQWKLTHFRMIVQNTCNFAVLFFPVNIYLVRFYSSAFSLPYSMAMAHFDRNYCKDISISFEIMIESPMRPLCWYLNPQSPLIIYQLIFTSLAKEVMFLVALVCLFVCLSVCLSVYGQHNSKSYEWIGMKFCGGVLGSTMKNWLHFGGDLGILRWVNEQKTP